MDVPGFLAWFADDGRQINPNASGVYRKGATGKEELVDCWPESDCLSKVSFLRASYFFALWGKSPACGAACLYRTFSPTSRVANATSRSSRTISTRYGCPPRPALQLIIDEPLYAVLFIVHVILFRRAIQDVTVLLGKFA